MKWITTLTASLFLSPLSAQEVMNPYLPTITKTVNGRVKLRIECPDVQKQIESLKTLTRKIDARECPEIQSKVNYMGLCVLDITDCLPKKIAQLQGLTSLDDGPNCWNTSLVLSGILPAIRETSPKAFENYMNSPFCQEVQGAQNLMPGDIGSIENQYKDARANPIHSYIYINDRLIFNKRGFDHHSGFELISMRNLKMLYPVDHFGECKENCSFKKDFEELLTIEQNEILEKKFPTLSIPRPRYFCRSFKEDNPESLLLLEEIIKEDIPKISKENLQEAREILMEGCIKYLSRVDFLKRTTKMCENACPLPTLRYFRCQSPAAYYQNQSPKLGKLYKEMDSLIEPLEKELEEHYLVATKDKEKLKKSFHLHSQKINDYLKKNNISIKMPPKEKEVIQFFLRRLDEIGNQLEQNSGVNL